jgi:hypothetical protein
MPEYLLGLLVEEKEHKEMKKWVGWDERPRFFDVTILEFGMGLFFIGASVFALAVAWTIVFGGGLEYAVKIGK